MGRAIGEKFEDKLVSGGWRKVEGCRRFETGGDAENAEDAGEGVEKVGAGGCLGEAEFWKLTEHWRGVGWRSVEDGDTQGTGGRAVGEESR